MGDLAPSRAAASSEDLCLITGASGFIGGHLARRLVQEGYSVRCLIRAGSDTSRLRALGVQTAIGDLRKARSLASAVEGARYVIHCGALVSDWATVDEITAVNVDGTRNLLEASADASVERFIHFSSTDVYGHPGHAGVDEDHRARAFANWYSQTKMLAETEVRRVESVRGLATVILRPATVYGPGSRDVVGEIARAIRGRHMLLIDRGRPIAGLCYVENLLDGAVLALQSGAALGHAFNLTDGLAVTWKEFTDTLAAGLAAPEVSWSLPYPVANRIGLVLEHGYRALRRATGLSMPALLSRQAVQVLGRNQDFSNRRARELLDWQPLVGYQAGMEATLEWLKAEYLVR